MAKKTIEQDQSGQQSKEQKKTTPKTAAADTAQTEQNEKPQTEKDTRARIYPDNKSEAILLRYPSNGQVTAVSDLKVDKKGNQNLVEVEPTLKNQPAFYRKLDSFFIANFFKNMRSQMQDPTAMPELFLVPFKMVAQVAEQLRQLNDDPQNDLLKATAKQYRTYTQELEKIKFDQARMPKSDLAAAGFDIEKLEEDGVFKEMELGMPPKRLYPLKVQLTDKISIDCLFAIRPVMNEYREISFELQSPLATPEFEQDENLRIELTADDKKNLFNNKTLERPLRHNGEYCMAAFSRLTGRMIYVPCKDVTAPDYVYNTRLSEDNKKDFSLGHKVHLENCHYANSDNYFSCDIQYDIHSQDRKSTNMKYSRPFIPDYLLRQLDKSQIEDLQAYKVLSKQGLKDKNDNPLNRDICISRDTNSVIYVSRQSQVQTQQVKTANQVQESPEYIPDMDVPECSASRGQTM